MADAAKSQKEKPREVARELETDEEEGRFNEKLKQIARTNTDEKSEPAKK